MGGDNKIVEFDTIWVILCFCWWKWWECFHVKLDPDTPKLSAEVPVGHPKDLLAIWAAEQEYEDLSLLALHITVPFPIPSRTTTALVLNEVERYASIFYLYILAFNSGEGTIYRIVPSNNLMQQQWSSKLPKRELRVW